MGSQLIQSATHAKFVHNESEQLIRKPALVPKRRLLLFFVHVFSYKSLSTVKYRELLFFNPKNLYNKVCLCNVHNCSDSEKEINLKSKVPLAWHKKHNNTVIQFFCLQSHFGSLFWYRICTFVEIGQKSLFAANRMFLYESQKLYTKGCVIQFRGLITKLFFSVQHIFRCFQKMWTQHFSHTIAAIGYIRSWVHSP